MSSPTVLLTPFTETLAICRLGPSDTFPDWALSAAFVAITRTPAELSIVCPAGVVPSGIVCERGWRALQVDGPLDFALTGIVAALTVPLARAGISVFVLSTYDTDYLLLREQAFARGCAALVEAGHRIR